MPAQSTRTFRGAIWRDAWSSHPVRNAGGHPLSRVVHLRYFADAASGLSAGIVATGVEPVRVFQQPDAANRDLLSSKLRGLPRLTDLQTRSRPSTFHKVHIRMPTRLMCGPPHDLLPARVTCMPEFPEWFPL